MNLRLLHGVVTVDCCIPRQPGEMILRYVDAVGCELRVHFSRHLHGAFNLLGARRLALQRFVAAVKL